mmetsp:Transcript_3328/g.12079  ORF Transcript_3328/g.12079 Transcript_3328/m.12079 type:complete len:290 (+) Transcript_3328:444-1313(+)
MQKLATESWAVPSQSGDPKRRLGRFSTALRSSVAWPRGASVQTRAFEPKGPPDAETAFESTCTERPAPPVRDRPIETSSFRALWDLPYRPPSFGIVLRIIQATILWDAPGRTSQRRQPPATVLWDPPTGLPQREDPQKGPVQRHPRRETALGPPLGPALVDCSRPRPRHRPTAQTNRKRDPPRDAFGFSAWLTGPPQLSKRTLQKPVAGPVAAPRDVFPLGLCGRPDGLPKDSRRIRPRPRPRPQDPPTAKGPPSSKATSEPLKGAVSRGPFQGVEWPLFFRGRLQRGR